MKIDAKTTLLLILAASILSLVGCQQAQVKGGKPVTSDSPPTATTQSEPSKFRFQQPTTQGSSAVESAIELSQKYTALIEDVAKLREDNLRLTQENESLKERVNPCETQLAQAQKELNEANELLIDMRIELNNWKSNVLGFRDEMRHADQAQLEALLKILTVLGGETNQDQSIPGGTSAETSNNSSGPEQPVAKDNSNG